MKTLKLMTLGALAAASVDAQASIQNVHTSYIMGDTYETTTSVMDITSGNTHVGAFGDNIIGFSYNFNVGSITENTQMVKSMNLIFNDKFNATNIGAAYINDNSGQASPKVGEYVDGSKSTVWAPASGTGSIFLDFAASQGWSEGDDELPDEDIFSTGELLQVTMLQYDTGNLMNESDLIGVEVDIYDQNTGETFTYIAGDTQYGLASGNMTNLPEPSSVMFFSMAALPLIFRRKRTS